MHETAWKGIVMRITVCAFQDTAKHSVAYRNFACVEDAVKFYQAQLEKDCVNVISTRVINRKLYSTRIINKEL